MMLWSDTGSLASALWCLLGAKGVDVLSWENFGKDWVVDVVEELKLNKLNVHVDDYGKLPDLKNSKEFKLIKC